MYLFMAVEKKQNVSILGKPVSINLEWADGMVGACAVFDTYESAEKYRANRKEVPIYDVQEASCTN